MFSPFRTILLSSLILLYSSPAVPASEEAFVSWQSFQITCFENPIAGTVSLSGQARENGIAAFTMNAFGKQYSLAQSDLAKIRGFPLYSLRVTSEAGYPQLGGYTVHARLRRDYYNSERKLISEEAYISVSKEKGLVVRIQTPFQGGGVGAR